MSSKFGWIDFSEKERRQMLDVVQLFSEHDTRDELGIGTEYIYGHPGIWLVQEDSTLNSVMGN